MVLAFVLFAVVHGPAHDVAAAQDRATDTAVTASTDAEPADLGAGLSFDTVSHRGWYDVFWTGKCRDLPFFDRLVCQNGRPTWIEITRKILAKAAPDARTAMRDRMTRLGRMIGHEWARPNDERRIDNGDLERWSEWLKTGTDVSRAVDRMATAARRLIERR